MLLHSSTDSSHSDNKTHRLAHRPPTSSSPGQIFALEAQGTNPWDSRGGIGKRISRRWIGHPQATAWQLPPSCSGLTYIPTKLVVRQGNACTSDNLALRYVGEIGRIDFVVRLLSVSPYRVVIFKGTASDVQALSNRYLPDWAIVSSIHWFACLRAGLAGRTALFTVSLFLKAHFFNKRPFTLNKTRQNTVVLDILWGESVHKPGEEDALIIHTNFDNHLLQIWQHLEVEAEDRVVKSRLPSRDSCAGPARY